MICAVASEAQKQDFLATLSGQPGPIACAMGVHVQAFWQLPKSGWSFYTQGQGEAPFALAVWGAAAQIIYTTTPPKADELASFCSAMGIASVQCALPLHGWAATETAMRYDWRQDALPQAATKRNDGYAINPQPNLLAATEFLNRNGQFSQQGEAASDAFYTRSCALVNRGVAHFWAVEADGEIASTAFSAAEFGGWAYLSAIETAESHRRKGLAGWLIGALCASLLAKNHRPTLLCRPEMAAFYAKIGFEAAGEVFRYQPPAST